MNEHPILALVRAKVRNPSQPFTFIADLVVHPNSGNELAAIIATSEIVNLTRDEPGCVAYTLLRDASEPDRFVAYETWRDIDALRDHLGTAHFNAVGAALAELLATPPAVRVLTALED